MQIKWQNMHEGMVTDILLLAKRMISPIKELQKIIDSGILFIHIPKTAGTSIAKTFYDLKVYPGHYKWWFYRGYFGRKKYDRLYKFCIVRNPYDRFFSAFEYLRNGGNSSNDKAFAEAYINKCLNFDEFISKFFESKKMRQWIHFIPQHEFVYNTSNKLMVDHVIKYEAMENEIQLLYSKFNTSKLLSHEKKNKSSHRKYINYYSEESAALVRIHYQKDFELFSYNYNHSGNNSLFIG